MVSAAAAGSASITGEKSGLSHVAEYTSARTGGAPGRAGCTCTTSRRVAALLPKVEVGQHARHVVRPDAVAQAARRRRRLARLAQALGLQLGVGDHRRNEAGAGGRAAVVARALRKVAAPAGATADERLLMREVGPPAERAVAKDPERVRHLDPAGCTVPEPHAGSRVPPRRRSRRLGGR
eukprot:CAMPEP_0202787184 /NCGR_PEP_ID=MMETSP1388-20130828/71821_1 /ASSEMBLY_ACC=CAM_ASM_000864 /TAXON_ID=37098 /ORGANISM="Isochrysis sp, Strain CCMP1244" /LENGTH=179 /DNA_ID=CAMNT_0049456765 /DNA_START=140 /DNA_END=675 /DNA_ORIENTATION=-